MGGPDESCAEQLAVPRRRESSESREKCFLGSPEGCIKRVSCPRLSASTLAGWLVLLTSQIATLQQNQNHLDQLATVLLLVAGERPRGGVPSGQRGVALRGKKLEARSRERTLQVSL
jgi:hypothetical protein